MPQTDWADEVHAAMRARAIATLATVPDAGLARLIGLCRDDPATRLVTLTSEQEGIGLMAGLWLGGARGVLAMQSSGTGNCINALSLPANLKAPVLMLVTMRGQWGEANPWQVPMGQGAGPVLTAMGTICFAVDESARVGETFAAAADLAFASQVRVAVLVGQKVIGAKGFGK